MDEEAGLPVSAAQVRMSERTSETGRVAGLRAGIEGAAGLIVLDRPDALNALTLAMREAVGLCLTRWARDPQVYAVVNCYTWENDKNGKGISFGVSLVQVVKKAEGDEVLGGGGGPDADKFFDTIPDDGDSAPAGSDGAASLFG